MKLTTRRNGFVVTAKGLEVERTESCTEVTVHRRNYCHKSVKYDTGPPEEYVQIETPEIMTLLRESETTVEYIRDPRTGHSIAEIRWDSRGVLEAYVLTKPSYTRSVYSGSVQVRGDSQYPTSYDEWLRLVMLTLEALAEAELPPERKRTTPPGTTGCTEAC